ncbi:MAG: hypothetical protein AVDCRST_MAG01-01-1157 [uncultured Rubrobacteraceae bacterium]|uniref:Nudix hydrolase domain-containing protein n=1 Tax=uncultured Rubrobacteraceae bacterium TaxID=349277 RepID=A0A6J4P1A0_9ACTN|nr:MAG: hypothetical protein AVDCRST_MAG01-01-1157 [uncultured Rubrobacteraceae bacterium]
MISFDRHGIRFKYRVAGLCLHDGYVLLTRADQDDYWIQPGGRVELAENTRTALHRELLEETGHESLVRDLLWIIENVVDLDETAYHELAFIYSLSPTDPTVLDEAWTHQTTDRSVRIELRWFESDRLEAVNFQPAFLRPLLQTPPETPQHMIAREPRHKRAAKLRAARRRADKRRR